MSAAPQPRLLTSGPDAVRSATARSKQIEVPVPFPWDLPPKESKIVWAPGSILVPAVSATPSVVTSYKVPAGFQAIIRRRANMLSEESSTFINGSGELVWTTDIDVDPTVTTPQGFTVNGMYQEPYTWGSFAQGTVPMAFNLWLTEQQIIRVKVTNIAFANAGAPNWLTSILEGWIWPVDKR